VADRHLEAVFTDDGDDPTNTPPQDRDAERAVLGAMLRDPDTITTVWDIIQADDFYHPRHELIAAELYTARARLEPTDHVSIVDRLRKSKNLTRAGGPAYIHELYNGALITTNADYHADIIRRHAERRRLIETGTRIAALGWSEHADNIADAVTQATTQLATIVRPIPGLDTPTHPWEPVDLTDILENGEDEEQPTVLARTDGVRLLYPAAIHAVAGEPESGKTWVGLEACRQELLAEHDALYVDWEDRAGRVVARLIQLGVPKALIRERFHYIRPMTALDPIGAAHLDRWAERSTVCIIDGITEAMTIHGLSLMDNEDAAKFLHLLPRRVADLGPAVLQIDHVVKDSDRQGRWAIGAGHKLAGLDGAQYGIKIAEPFGKGKAGRARITIGKDRPGSVREHAKGSVIAELVLDSTQHVHALTLRLDEPTGTPRGDDGEARPTYLMEQVSRVIERTPGLTGRGVEELVKGKRDYIRLALKTLVIESYVLTEQNGQAVHYTSNIPFRKDPDE
jgi:hypothetical protein